MKFLATFVTAAIATLATVVSADKIFWTQPANNSDVYAGCPVVLGYRVQYSDLALLHWVQLQALSADGGTVLVDRIDYTTRETWDAQNARGKNVSWTVPAQWAPGAYILRAFGNATYPCTNEGVRAFCVLELQDRIVVQLKQLPVDATCASVNATVSDPATGPGTPKTTVSTSGGTTGYSTPMHIVLDPAVLNVQNGTAVAPELVAKDGATPLLRHTHQQDFAQKLKQEQQQQQQKAQANPGLIHDMSGMVPSGGGRSGVSMVLVVVALLGVVGQF
ncbi:hypothetical protein MVEG_08215 [Podila verticillata NRRL 6337]|nr:MAG: hypothetical protein BYD32DRAFT_433204 [Podila humilis]KFH66114.1 hypothetical protein MVEG_08215 [Podila verticillata NRRL 6337]